MDVPSLYERAWKLKRAGDYRALVALLQPLPRELHIAEPELGYILSHAWHRTGRWMQALELLRRLEEPCARRGKDRLNRLRLNSEGVVLMQLGALVEAERTFQLVLDAASPDGDELLLAWVNNNLGGISTCRWHLPEAISYYHRALLYHDRVGDLRDVARVHTNIAHVCVQLGRWELAERHIDQASRYGEWTSAEDERALRECVRAELVLLQGDVVYARRLAEAARGRFIRIRNAVGESEPLKILMRAAVAERRFDAARRYFQEAWERVRRSGSPMLEAEILDERVGIERAAGNAAEARTNAEWAAVLYEHCGSPEKAERVRALAAAHASDAHD